MGLGTRAAAPDTAGTYGYQRLGYVITSATGVSVGFAEADQPLLLKVLHVVPGDWEAQPSQQDHSQRLLQTHAAQKQPNNSNGQVRECRSQVGLGCYH